MRMIVLIDQSGMCKEERRKALELPRVKEGDGVNGDMITIHRFQGLIITYNSSVNNVGTTGKHSLYVVEM